jgi:hypothetical protein
VAITCLRETSYLWRIVIKKLTSLTPKTNNTWGKLRVSAFQWLLGLGAHGQSLLNEIFISVQRLRCHLPYFLPLVYQRILHFIPAHSYQTLHRLYSRTRLSLSKSLSQPWRAWQKWLKMTPPLPSHSHPSLVSYCLNIPLARVEAKTGCSQMQGQLSWPPRLSSTNKTFFK